MTHRFEVRLWGTLVGHLVPTSEGRLAFRSDPSYRELPRRPILAQRLEDDLARTWVEKQDLLPRWFGHLLPERLGRLRALICKVHRLDAGDDVGLLEALGGDLPGAVVVERDPSGGPDIEELAEALDVGAEPSRAALALRHSLAGLQLKISVVARDDRISLPARDQDGDHILKIAGLDFAGLAENEAAMMDWARRSGFDTAKTKLVASADAPDFGIPLEQVADRALLVRRFDRSPQGRIHQEDLAQVVHVPVSETAKYSGTTFVGLARLARSLLGEEGFLEYVRRLVLTIAQGNADAHLKNWSLRYEDPTRATWAPLYDQISTVAWPRLDANLALRLGTVQQFDQVTRGSLARLAAAGGVPVQHCAAAAFATLERLRATWPETIAHSPLLAEHRRLLVEHWRRVPLLREAGPLAEG